MRKPPYTAADFKASKPAVMGLVEVLFNRRLSTPAHPPVSPHPTHP